MGDVSEEDSDIEQGEEESIKKHKKVYSHQTRDISTGTKKQKVALEVEEDEIDLENLIEKDVVDDEEYYQKLMPKDIDYEEDDFKRQLRFEQEEQLRKEQQKKDEEVKTKKDPDGTEYEWDPAIKGWFPKVPDQKFIEYQQTYTAADDLAAGAKPKELPQNPYQKLIENTNYYFNGAFYKWDFTNNAWIDAGKNVYAYVDYMTGVNYEWNAENNEWEAKAQPAQQNAQDQAKTKEKPKPKEGWFDINDDKNTNVYVSGLPLDITDEEFEELMSKYGIIMKDPLTHKLKIKLYKENDEVKGDGRCCYLMPESVKLCLQLLDGSTYRDHKISVEKAKFEMKGNYDPTKAAATKDAAKKKLSKQKEKKLVEKQRQRLLDWEDRPEIVRQKHEKVVVIKNLFSVSDFGPDRAKLNKFKEDLKTDLEVYGDVKKIIIYEHNPEGVVTVSFREVEMADGCCEYLNNRVWKNKRIIKCETWDGETRFDHEETEEERQKRIDDWHKFLESDE